MSKTLFTLTFLIACIYYFTIDESNFYNRNDTHALLSQYKELKSKQLRLTSQTPEWYQSQSKIDKIKRRLDGYVKAEAPDEYIKYQRNIRTPAGKQNPEYELGYLTKEFQKISRTKSSSTQTLDWVFRGPGNVSGRARGLIVDPDDESKSTWYVGSVGGGVWKTSDAGENWRELTKDMPVLSFSTIAMANSDRDIIYAGTGESFFNIDVINGNGIYKSTDRGESWTPLLSTLENLDFNNISRIIVDPNDADIVLASTTVGQYKLTEKSSTAIMKSVDGGTTWTKVHEINSAPLTIVNKILQLVSTPGNFNFLFAAVQNEGVLKSTNAGDSWFKSNTGINDLKGRFELAVSPINPNKIFAASEGNNTTKLHVSEDAGESWQRITLSGTNSDWLGAQGWYNNTITVNPEDDDIIFVGGVLLHKITINGSNGTISDLNTGPVHVDNHNLVTFSTSDGSWRILNANDGGIGVSGSEDENWSAPINGLSTTQFYGVDKKPGASAYMGGMQDNGTWRSPEDPSASDNWLFQIGGDGYEVSWHFNDPSKIIGAFQFNGFLRTTDGGNSYSSATTNLTDVGVGKGPFISKIGQTNDDPDLLFAVGSSGVWKSTNFGANWKLSNLSTQSHWEFSNSMEVKVSKSNPNIVWAGSGLANGSKIYVSTDRGENFTPVNIYDIEMGAISGLATHPTEDSTAYFMFSFANYPKILRTTDLGQTWEDISGYNGIREESQNGFPDVAVYDLLVMPHATDTIWAATEIGLFESTNNGTNWHYADNGLPAVAIWQMIHSEDEIILATHGRGIITVTIPELMQYKTFAPLFVGLTQTINNSLAIDLYLRSSYDSTQILINDQVITTLDNNDTPKDTVIYQPILTEGTYIASAKSFRSGIEYNSIERTIEARLLAETVTSYANDFNSSTGEDFFGEGFSIAQPSGFQDAAIHSSHPYSDGSQSTFTLKNPIMVQASNSMLTYDNIAIVEPADPGAVYGDQNFWDYVVVEGSKDGVEWVPLSDGYDANLHNDWLQTYNSSGTPDASLYKSNSIDLTNTFSPGDVILIRFRLFADPFVNGWGWVIDNLAIQTGAVSVEDKDLKIHYSLEQNYPNPFNPTTTIKFSVSKTGKVELKIYDNIGQLVDVLIDKEMIAGNHSLNWSAENLASGVYFYRLESGSFTSTKKLIVLK